jgi:hypothetical protein
MRKFIIIVFILFNILTFYGQNHYGYYKLTLSVGCLGGIQRIHLDTNYTFEYVYAFDLFYDKAHGTYSTKNDSIFLNYMEEFDHKWQSFDSIETEYILGNVKFSRMEYNTHELIIPDPSTHMRPGVLLYKRNNLILLKNADNVPSSSRMIKYKRVKSNNWNNSGASYLSFGSD